jgi:hypothetical protein
MWLHFPFFDICDLHEGKQNDWGAKVRSMMSVQHLGMVYNGVNSILGSHDQIGCRKNGGRDEEGRLHRQELGNYFSLLFCRYFIDRVGGRDNWHGRAMVRMWYSASAFARSLPMMFMGTETLQGRYEAADIIFIRFLLACHRSKTFHELESC